MTKERMKMEILFNMYKDTTITPSRDFRKKLMGKYDDKTITDLIAKITRYQVEKYGRVLDSFIDKGLPGKNLKADYRNFLARLRYRRRREKEGKEYNDK